VSDDKTSCGEWRAEELAHQSTGGANTATCVPLAPALWGPFCCAPSLAAPAGCPSPPIVFDIPQLLCPAP
jgi:hypothetical protein